MNKLLFSFHVTPEFHGELTRLADAAGLSRSAVIRLLVRRELNAVRARAGQAIEYRVPDKQQSLLRPT